MLYLYFSELNTYRSKIEEFVEAKRLSDKQMVSNFVILLNEKKSKIQYLTGLLEAFRNGRTTTNPPIKTSRKQNKKAKLDEETSTVTEKTKKEVISDSDSEDSIILKSEPEGYNSEEKRFDEIPDIAVPSTSKAGLGFLSESSPPREITLPAFKKDTAAEPNLLFTEIKANCIQQEVVTNKATATSSDLHFNTQDMLDEL